MKYYNTDNRADYCEFFEATPEFSSEKIPRGTAVVFDGDKIRPAKKGEVPFGVVSSFPIMAGNSGGTDAGTAWGGKYLKDEFGNFIWEEADIWEIKNDSFRENRTHKTVGFVSDGHVPKGAVVKRKLLRKINPLFNKDEEYIPRVKRPEWNMVGLLGRVKILKGQPVDKRWIKLKSISETVDEWLIR